MTDEADMVYNRFLLVRVGVLRVREGRVNKRRVEVVSINDLQWIRQEPSTHVLLYDLSISKIYIGLITLQVPD